MFSGWNSLLLVKGRFELNKPTKIMRFMFLFLVVAAQFGPARAAAPLINSQPKSQSVAAGYRTILRVTATASPPASYQWLFNGSAMTGQTTSTITIEPTLPHHAGTYSALVSNTDGSVTSAGAVLTVVGDLPFTFKTFAGSGVAGTVNGTGKTAQFNLPAGIMAGKSGEFYVTDRGMHFIRKITADGVVTTLAGMVGVSGSQDGLGSEARFNYCSHMALDSAGNFFLVDAGNNLIRKVTPQGMVTTVAGKAEFDAQGNVIAGSADGVGSAARFNTPWRVAVDRDDNVYVADTFNYTIRKITPAGEVSTFAGTKGVSASLDGVGTAARFGRPNGLVCDAAGNLYVADEEGFTIRKITPDRVVTTLAGLAGVSGSADGVGNLARFASPYGLAIDASGNIYVADGLNHAIRKVTPDGTVVTVAGQATTLGNAEGMGRTARFNNLGTLAFDSVGNLFVADHNNHVIRKGFLTPVFVSSGPSFGFTAGKFGFTLKAPAAPLILESSVDFVNWSPITTEPSTGTLNIIDPQSGSEPQRFYRSRLP